MFVDECEKVKNLIHVHSFGHDFHLRCIQEHISRQHKVLNPASTEGTPEVPRFDPYEKRLWVAEILKPGYHLTGLLRDFETVYPYAPSFSRNFMVKGILYFTHLGLVSHKEDLITVHPV